MKETLKSLEYWLSTMDNINVEDKKIFSEVMSKIYNDITNKIPNFNYFAIPTGKKYGDLIEYEIIHNMFNAIKSKTTRYDALYNDNVTMEIKSIRAFKLNKKDDLPLFQRICNIEDKDSLSSPSFQQVKPSYADYFLLHILFGDGEKLFLIPSMMIQKQPGKEHREENKIFLAYQHSNNLLEGQINYNEILQYSDIFEIKDYNHSKPFDIQPHIDRVMAKVKELNFLLPPIEK